MCQGLCSTLLELILKPFFFFFQLKKARVKEIQYIRSGDKAEKVLLVVNGGMRVGRADTGTVPEGNIFQKLTRRGTLYVEKEVHKVVQKKKIFFFVIFWSFLPLVDKEADRKCVQNEV